MGETLAQTLGIPLVHHDFTLPDARRQPLSFSADTLVIFGVPVYAGRVPNLMLPFVASAVGSGALAVPVVLFGNRAFDDALMELRNILEAGGFRSIAGAAFVGEHSFGRQMAGNRPDANDLALAKQFALDVAKKLEGYDETAPHVPVFVAGNDPVKPYFRPTDAEGNFVDIRKARPSTTDDCVNCKTCAKHCPMGSIDFDNPKLVTGICIKCNACVKLCPKDAKQFTHEGYLFHKDDILARYGGDRKEPSLFL